MSLGQWKSLWYPIQKSTTVDVKLFIRKNGYVFVEVTYWHVPIVYACSQSFYAFIGNFFATWFCKF